VGGAIDAPGCGASGIAGPVRVAGPDAVRDAAAAATNAEVASPKGA
jgi:hypothetical protein